MADIVTSKRKSNFHDRGSLALCANSKAILCELSSLIPCILNKHQEIKGATGGKESCASGQNVIFTVVGITHFSCKESPFYIRFMGSAKSPQCFRGEQEWGCFALTRFPTSLSCLMVFLRLHGLYETIIARESFLCEFFTRPATSIAVRSSLCGAYNYYIGCFCSSLPKAFLAKRPK